MILRLLCVANGLLLQGKPWLITYFYALYCARDLFSMQPHVLNVEEKVAPILMKIHFQVAKMLPF